MEAHDKQVSTITASVRQFYDRKEPYRIYHGSTNSTRRSELQRNRMVDTSQLTNVLKVDTEVKTALVEPNVPMDSLVAATLLHGLMPPVVMEFPGITTGGGFSGTSGESSSFRYGFFDRTVNWVEIVLANGEKVISSKTHMPDLFYGAAASYGTLGVITLLELQLVEAKPYVELTYHPTNSMAEALQKINEASSDPSTDYLDGILFSKSRGVICVGRLVDAPRNNVKSQTFTGARDPWFYIHAERTIKNNPGEVITEAVPLVDYFFRYDRGGFWVGKYAFKYFITPFNRITRWLLDGFLRTRVMYHALHQSGQSNIYIIQDVAVPYSSAEEFVEYLDADFKHYPLWLCPLKQTGKDDGSMSSPHGLLAEQNRPAPHAPDMLLNFGVWGPGPKDRQTFVEMNRRLEHKVDSLGGKKWLYAQAYYTEEEFWNIYNRKEYDSLRTRYHATHLPSIYDKVRVDVDAERQRINASWGAWLRASFWGVWPFSGLYGVVKAAAGGDYLLPRTSADKLGSLKSK